MSKKAKRTYNEFSDNKYPKAIVNMDRQGSTRKSKEDPRNLGAEQEDVYYHTKKIWLCSSSRLLNASSSTGGGPITFCHYGLSVFIIFEREGDKFTYSRHAERYNTTASGTSTSPAEIVH